VQETESDNAWCLLNIDWGNIATVIASWLGVAKLWRQLRVPRSAKTQSVPEHRELAYGLLDAVLQVKRLIKKRRQAFHDPRTVQQELDTQSNRADEFFRRARTEWGPRVDELKAALVVCTNEFRYATVRMEKTREGRISETYVEQTWNEFNEVAYLHNDDDSDAFSRKLQSAVDELEAFLSPYLGR
jgi:hypothetical protein